MSDGWQKGVNGKKRSEFRKRLLSDRVEPCRDCGHEPMMVSVQTLIDGNRLGLRRVRPFGLVWGQTRVEEILHVWGEFTIGATVIGLPFSDSSSTIQVQRQHVSDEGLIPRWQ